MSKSFLNEKLVAGYFFNLLKSVKAPQILLQNFVLKIRNFY